MFARKKPEPAKRRNHDLTQFGLGFDPTADLEDDGGDSDLEAELAAIAGGGGQTKPKGKPKPTLLPPSELDKIVADSLRDVGSDEDDEGDELDPDLLGELQEIAGGDIDPENVNALEVDPAANTPEETLLPTTTLNTVDIIQSRIEMYKLAEANAKQEGEGAKARRLGRGLKTLNDLLKQAKGGKTISNDDIPPEVSVKAANKPAENNEFTLEGIDDAPLAPVRKAPTPPAKSPPAVEADTSGTEDPSPAISPATTPVAAARPTNPIVEQLRGSQREYKAAALQSKRSGDTSTALQFLKVVKQFDMVIQMVENGQEVDLSDMPPPPDQFLEFMAKMQATAEAPPATDNTPTPSPAAPVNAAPATVELATPATVLEALQQRLDKYKSVEEAAKTEGNASKARRFGRIVKQYEDAIKLHKAGRAVPYDELPVPPGFGPLPSENSTSQPTPASTPTSAKSTAPTSPAPSRETPASAPSPGAAKKTAPHRPDLTTRTSGNQHKNQLAENQMQILLDRQKEFKVAAVQAKKAGEIEQAKEYLKIYKGFEALLNAASGGLPVDLSTLPVPPSQRDNLEASFAIVAADEEHGDDDMSDIGVRIEEQLAKQLMMCKNTRDHHKAMGDIAGMNRFENLALTVQKDLDLVRFSKRKNFELPKFHYEKRSFNIVHCNTDLTDNELEIVVVRGINYNVANPKDVDTYVKVEFPLLNDESFKTKTSVVKDTDSPEYDQRFIVDIQRSSRQFQRIFKRNGVKFEVYSRGGFLRSDTLIGTVNVKLQPLETKCDIHDTFGLMDGRRAVGGKLEIKVRIRNPILTKQIEHIDEKWLVLDA